MAYKPILFSADMVHSLLAGRKTMTRRIVKTKYSNTDVGWKEDKYGKRLVERQNDVPAPVKNADGTTTHHMVAYRELHPVYKFRDILWVREEHYRFGYWVRNGFSESGKQKWAFTPKEEEVSLEVFKYNDNPPQDFLISRPKENCDSVPHWYKRNSLFMPKEAARIFLKVTGVKVERVHDISEQDAISEGISKIHWSRHVPDSKYVDYLDQSTENFMHGLSPRDSFRSLWSSINGSESWEANPFVFVYSFEKLLSDKMFDAIDIKTFHSKLFWKDKPNLNKKELEAIGSFARKSTDNIDVLLPQFDLDGVIVNSKNKA